MRKLCFLFLGAVLLTASPVRGEEGKGVVPTPGDKCPVCGMFVAKYPDWVAGITFRDGTYAVFDGPKDMFKYYFDLAGYRKGKTVDDIGGIYVTEYYTTKMMPAEEVYFIIGSDVLGPMGRELIPVKGDADSGEFMRDHDGKKRLSFQEITMEDIPE